MSASKTESTETPAEKNGRLISRGERAQILFSAAWAAGQQFVVMGSTAIVGVILARTLTVSDFGLFSFATSLAAIGMAVLTAGLSGLAIKALLDEPEHQPRTMTVLVLIREGFALAAFVGIAITAAATGTSRELTAALIAGLGLFSRAWDAVEYWYQARVQSKRSASVRIKVVLAMVVVRVVAAALGANVWVFLILYAVEAFANSGALLWRYMREPDSPRFGAPSGSTARSLLGRSWWLLLSSIAAQINLRADQVLLQAMIGTAAVGTYAAAARMSEILYFLPTVYMTATFPLLVNIRREFGPESREYEELLQSSYDKAFWLGIALVVPLYLLGPTVLTLLYGERYAASGAILQIHVLALPFVFMAGILSKWILAEDLLKASLVRHGIGAALNVALNFWLIPIYGGRGAATATVASYIFASYIACFLGPSTFPAARQMTLALVAPIRLTASRVLS